MVYSDSTWCHFCRRYIQDDIWETHLVSHSALTSIWKEYQVPSDWVRWCCAEKFDSSAALTRHWREKHSLCLICYVCNQLVSDRNWVTHKRSHLESDYLEYKCPGNGCVRIFYRFDELQDHFRSKHWLVYEPRSADATVSVPGIDGYPLQIGRELREEGYEDTSGPSDKDLALRNGAIMSTASTPKEPAISKQTETAASGGFSIARRDSGTEEIGASKKPKLMDNIRLSRPKEWFQERRIRNGSQAGDATMTQSGSQSSLTINRAQFPPATTGKPSGLNQNGADEGPGSNHDMISPLSESSLRERASASDDTRQIVASQHASPDKNPRNKERADRNLDGLKESSLRSSEEKLREMLGDPELKIHLDDFESLQHSISLPQSTASSLFPGEKRLLAFQDQLFRILDDLRIKPDVRNALKSAISVLTLHHLNVLRVELARLMWLYPKRRAAIILWLLLDIDRWQSTSEERPVPESLLSRVHQSNQRSIDILLEENCSISDLGQYARAEAPKDIQGQVRLGSRLCDMCSQLRDQISHDRYHLGSGSSIELPECDATRGQSCTSCVKLGAACTFEFSTPGLDPSRE